MAGEMPPRQVQEVPDHMTTTARKQRVMNAVTQLPSVVLFCPEAQSMQQGCPCAGWVFAPQLNQCGKSLTGMPGDIFFPHNNSEFQQVGLQE